jgi:hypothetical protein
MSGGIQARASRQFKLSRCQGFEAHDARRPQAPLREQERCLLVPGAEPYGAAGERVVAGQMEDTKRPELRSEPRILLGILSHTNSLPMAYAILKTEGVPL